LDYQIAIIRKVINHHSNVGTLIPKILAFGGGKKAAERSPFYVGRN